MKIRDYIARSIEESGVADIVTVPGTENLPLLDSFEKSGKFSSIPIIYIYSCQKTTQNHVHVYLAYDP